MQTKVHIINWPLTLQATVGNVVKEIDLVVISDRHPNILSLFAGIHDWKGGCLLREALPLTLPLQILVTPEV